ncbi:GNAT family N-acetyltransferase [Lysinibacter cavernae]|uniref:Putative acetyltransferase n=1 Tax=Lysinibacter cavernae TaxID=1640652 RepID=A0A7X5QZK2_9MICO|nr:GNAT family N-acetyltransferase [Lysinibacter cavernae]NIH52920.1 putative acetyltransferase [Lysinibacter cavernae]
MSQLLVRPCFGQDEWPTIVKIWRSSVEATHTFLTVEDINRYELRMVTHYLPAVELDIATIDGHAVGFLGWVDDSIEMLFVDAGAMRRGVGTALLHAAQLRSPQLVLDVNEQNPAALSFYEHSGFLRVGRSETDGDGRPFPIIHLRYGR